MKDPVCGKEIDPKTVPYTSVYHNMVYSFCSQTCKTAFDKNPAKYAKEKPDGVYCYSCDYKKSYGGPAFYLFVGLIMFLIMFLLLSWWLRWK
jgi:YHS domain-containing protein